jgi:hypothetical protein
VSAGDLDLDRLASDEAQADFAGVATISEWIEWVVRWSGASREVVEDLTLPQVRDLLQQVKDRRA